MSKYNLYKIDKAKEPELLKKLEKEGLILSGRQTVGGSTLSFYISNDPKPIEIWWIKLYQDFIKTEPKPENLAYFGILLISNDKTCYAISLGKTHFYLKSFCDTDFGLSLAERIVDSANLKTKHSKLFGSKKNTIITTYHSGSDIDYGSGESMHFLRAKTIDEVVWGKIGCFGHSALLNIDIPPSGLPELLTRIEETLSSQPLLRLPKVIQIKDEPTQKELDQVLVNAILVPSEGGQLTEKNVSLSGVEFIFSDHCQYTFYVRKGPEDDSGRTELTIDNLRTFIKEKEIDLEQSLNDIRIKVKSDTKKWSIPLKEALDFVVQEDRKCLIDGRWHEFNQSYLDFLKEQVDEIVPVFQGEVSGTEPEFNKGKESEGYINCDREMQVLDKKYRVEAADLFKDETMFFVKFGDVRKMNYVIDQSESAVRLLKSRKKKLKIAGSDRKVKKICLWLVLKDRATRINQLSELDSLIFHMKIVDWRREVQDAGFDPVVYVSWKKEEISN